MSPRRGSDRGTPSSCSRSRDERWPRSGYASPTCGAWPSAWARAPSRGCGSASRPRARSPRRAARTRCPSARCTHSPSRPGTTARCSPCSTPAAARPSRPPGRARSHWSSRSRSPPSGSAPSSRAAASRGGRGGAGRYASGARSRRLTSPCPRARPPRMPGAPPPPARRPRAGTRSPSRDSCRATCARRTRFRRRGGGSSVRAGRSADQAPGLRRPAAGRRDRAPRLPYAVVAGHVRPGAVEAERHLPGRLGGRAPARLPHLLALRHRLAHHEHRGRPRRAPARHRHRAAGGPARPGRRPTGALHARGAALQRRGDPHLRALRLPRGGDPSPLLPGQRRGRAHHVADPVDARRTPRRHPGGRARGADRPGALQAMILAIETSCDDTCAAVVTREGEIRSNVISSQGIHDRYGGVVPEVAARHHLELANAVVDDALGRAAATLEDVDLVAVTQGPGLVGALLVGLATAKGIAAARELPLAPVDHLQGHVAANFLCDGDTGPFEPPFLCLIASGGHTFLARVTAHDGFAVLGRTLDDAAGEAIDKGARLLGLPFPGGPALERLAREGDPASFAFPRGERMGGLDFSFAGLKTALLYAVRELGEQGARARRADLAASYQQAVVEALVLRTQRALRATAAARLAVGGGVAANTLLRERLAGLGVQLHVPPRSLCTDNAAMIGSAARWAAPLRGDAALALDAYATGRGPGAAGGASDDL